MKGAVFLDRDGTINEEVSYLNDPDSLYLIPGAVEAIRLLNEASIPAIVVSNQAGVGRGYFSAATVEAIHERLAEQLARHGAYLDAIYFCPHHPDEECNCRKPKTGMLTQAAQEHEIDIQRAFVVGDKSSDLEAGYRAGCRTVLVLTGYGEQSREAFFSSLQPFDLGFQSSQPLHVSKNLYGAVKWILAEEDVKL